MHDGKLGQLTFHLSRYFYHILNLFQVPESLRIWHLLAARLYFVLIV